MPVPLQRGQTLSSDARMALRINSERFGIPFMASRREVSALKVMISCLFFFMACNYPLAFDFIITLYYYKLLPCITNMSMKIDMSNEFFFKNMCQSS